MTTFTAKKAEEFIEEEIRAWVREDVHPSLRQAIKRRQKHIPEETFENLEHEILKATGEVLGGYELSFQDSGRLVDMRQLNWDKRPIQIGDNFIYEWAKKKGKNKFRKGIPGYTKKSRSNLTEEQQIQRIASAIIASKTKNRKYKRRGQWYDKTIYSLIGRLTARLTRNQSAWIEGATRDKIEEMFTSTVGDLKVFRQKVTK